jgi:ribosomal protein S2
LDTYTVSLRQGVNPAQMVKQSFVHNERTGVQAIDQSPLRKGHKALRLYVYPDTDTNTLHLITVGEKDQQSRDVNECCDYVKELAKQKEGQGGREQGT